MISRMVMNRPELLTLSCINDFDAWYWLKAELMVFCRAKGLKVSGNKADLAQRIRYFLVTGSQHDLKQAPHSRPQSVFDWHSEVLSVETIITDSYKNTQNVRRFMQSQVGKTFKFSIPLMAWFKANEGKTLGDAVAEWHRLQAEKKRDDYKTEIPASNEYNRYVRDFMTANPNKSLVDARQGWAYRRSIPGSNRYEPSDLNQLSGH